ncbi:reverse transcriptase domain-containing protein [Tanacetum coccineum]
MAEEDEEKTAFITSQGIFCYTKMPFGLRNAGATYQRLADKAFHKQIGRNFEVYVDDLVIKSHTEDEIVRDIEETFKTLREINLKLNPKKCIFGVEEGMFLGYKVNTRGLKVCPDKVDAVLSLPSLKFLKDVQKLNEKLASLNRFLAKSAEKSLQFFKTLKKSIKKSDFHWNAEVEEAFKQMKQLIAELPMLTVPMEKEELIVYLTAAKETVSAVLMTEREAKQMPIYFVNRALRGSEITYTSMEKLVLALVHAIKQPEEDSTDTLMEVEEELPEPWILFTDGSSCIDGSGAGLILTNPKGIEFTYAVRFRFDATNDEAEYEALIAGLRIAEQMGVKNLQANVDSRLVANQVNGTYVAKEADMIRYFEVEILAVVEEEGDTWMTPIFKYLTKETLSADVKKERAVRRKSQRFDVINGTLYKKSFLGPWLRKSKSQFGRRNKSKARYKKQELDGRITSYSMGTPHHDKIQQWRHSVRINIRNGGGLPSRNWHAYTQNSGAQNNKALEINLSLLEEQRGETAIREAKSKAKIEKYHNSKVRSASFKLGDLVYRNNDASHAEDTRKLGPKWEGPYEVTEALGKGAYKLRDRDEKQLPRTWNVSNLKKCYIHKM